MSKACAVPGCPNKSNQGRFIGDICAPCHEMFEFRVIHPRLVYRLLEGLRLHLKVEHGVDIRVKRKDKS